LTQAVFDACQAGDYDQARAHREHFMPLEDLRDQWGPARVLHAAVELAGIARTGPIPPFVSAIDASQRATLEPVAAALLQANASISLQST